MLRKLAPLAIVLCLIGGVGHAQSAMQTVKQALRATQAVRDYTATVTVTVDAPNVRIPRRTVKVYYKRPDRVHVESDGIAILPRDALLMGNLAEHIETYANASFNGTGTLGGRPVQCIKLAPLEEGPGSGRVLVWIDSDRHLLLKSEIWRGGKAMLTVRFKWMSVGSHWMPERITAHMASGAMTGRDEGGTIELSFSNYRINQGLSDDIFTEGP